jgi:hypothetical protein
MKKNMLIGLGLVTFTGIQLSAQTTQPQQPVKTGNEWKMPSDVFKRSRAFAENLQKKLGLDSVQTRKVYDAYLANTKTLDEILVRPVNTNEKQAALNANKAAFNETLKGIFTSSQYRNYLKIESEK